MHTEVEFISASWLLTAAGMTQEELRVKLAECIKNEAYEIAAIIQKELDRRTNN